MSEQVCARTGKTAYPSKSAASRARAVIRRRRDPCGEMQVFRCGSCGGWLVDAVEAARLYARGGQAGPMWAAFVRFEFPTTDGTYSQPALMKERDA